MNHRQRTALAQAIEYCVWRDKGLVSLVPPEKIIEWQAVLGETGDEAHGGPVTLSTDNPAALPALSSERSAGQLSFALRRELLDYAMRALRNNQPDIAAMLIGAYEQLMRAGL